MQAIWNYQEGFVLVVGLISNLLTILLSILALWGLIAKRKQLTLAFQLFITSHLDRRMNRVQDTLSKLDSLSYDEKSERREVTLLIAQLCGELSAVSGESDKLLQLVEELHQYHHREKTLTEKHKRYVLSKLRGILDELDHEARLRILGREKS